jgi:hypothetical protein
MALKDTQEYSIASLVRENETNYTTGTTTISKYVQKSMYDDLNKIDAYLNSKHITGDTDALDREKPFFNIVTAAVNIWYRATDIDRKNIRIKPVKSKDTIAAYLATIKLHSWMRKTNFGATLNDWGRSLARYGSSVLKFVEKDGTLYSEVVPWNRLIVDPVDFENNIKIEILELTEAQLRSRKGYDKEMVDALCNALQARETIDKTQIDTKSHYIKLYEVHGMLPLSYLTGKEEDSYEYVQQMHVVSFVAKKEKGTFEDFTLVKGKEAQDPYMLTHLIKEDGQTLSIGAVHHLFEAQWMMNHTVKSIKDQLDLASKLIFQTADPAFVGQNALSAIETGDILIHNGQPLTQVANTSHDITALQSFGNQWKGLSNEITGISESMLGNTAPSGTAWRQVETLLQQNQSLFELMTENKGFYIEEMLRRFVIPHIKTKLDTKEEIVATLSDHGIEEISELFIKNESVRSANKKIIGKNLDYLRKKAPRPVTSLEKDKIIQEESNGLRESLNSLNGSRFFKPSELSDKTWKQVFENFEWECEVDVTGESTDKDLPTTLNTLLSFFIKKQGQPLTPMEKFTINKILTATSSISPVEISQVTNTPQPALAQAVP